MNWATRRRFIILLIVGAVVTAFLTVMLIVTLHTAPSCFDGVQNQSETGIDCGGSCQYLCTAEQQPPTVLFTQIVPSSAGRADVIASVENKNANAVAKAVPYTIALYNAKQVLLQTVSGTLDLPSGTTAVFVPHIVTGNEVATSAFLSIDSTAPVWYMEPRTRTVPTVINTTFDDSAASPRITATLMNPSTLPLSNIRVIVFVRGAGANIIAASATIVPEISGQGQANATFTWNTAFSATPLSIEVLPIVGLP